MAQNTSPSITLCGRHVDIRNGRVPEFERGAVALSALSAILAVVEWLKFMFRNEITLGDIFAVAVPLTISMAIGAYFWRRRVVPFKMEFSDQPFVLSPSKELRRSFHKKITLPKGRSRITLAMQTRIATSGDPFNIRFVEHPRFSWRWRDVATVVIEIVEVNVPEWEREAELERDFIGANTVDKQPNGVGGFFVSTRKPKRWVVGQPLWIELMVEAHKPWSGYLSFEGRTDRRVFGRRRVIVR